MTCLVYVRLQWKCESLCLQNIKYTITQMLLTMRNSRCTYSHSKVIILLSLLQLIAENYFYGERNR